MSPVFFYKIVAHDPDAGDKPIVDGPPPSPEIDALFGKLMGICGGHARHVRIVMDMQLPIINIYFHPNLLIEFQTYFPAYEYSAGKLFDALYFLSRNTTIIHRPFDFIPGRRLAFELPALTVMRAGFIAGHTPQTFNFELARFDAADDRTPQIQAAMIDLLYHAIHRAQNGLDRDAVRTFYELYKALFEHQSR